MLFPNMFYATPFSFNPVWGIALINFIFNLGDLLGRILTNFRKLFNKQSLIYLFIIRFFFFFTTIAAAKNTGDPILSSDGFAFVNTFLYALMNGMSSSIWVVI